MLGLKHTFVVAILASEVPVSRKQITNEVAQLQFEIGVTDLVIQPRDHDTVGKVEPRSGIGACDGIELAAGSAEQRLTHSGFEDRFPVTGKPIPISIVSVVVVKAADFPDPAGSGTFLPPEIDVGVILHQFLRVATDDAIIEDSIVVLRIDATAEDTVKFRQRRLGAVKRIAAGNHRVVCGDGRSGVFEDSQAERSEHGAAGQRNRQHFGLGQVAKVVGLRGGAAGTDDAV